MSDGVVSLELIIEDTAKKQLENIAKRSKKPAESAFKKVGASMERAMTPNAKNVQKAVANAWSKAAKQAKATPIHFEVAVKDTDLLQQKLDNTYAQIGAVEERLRNAENAFNLTDDSDVENIRALDLEITALQSKLISLQGSANATEKKLNDALEAPAREAEKAAEKARKAAEREAEKMAKAAEKAAQKAENAYRKAYNQIAQQAQRAAQQAEKWALQAERAQSKSAAKAARKASIAYAEQERACRIYANKYADAQADASEKSAKAVERAQKRAQKASEKAAAAATKANRKMAQDSSKGASGMGNAFAKVGKIIGGSLKAVFVTAVLYKFFRAFQEHLTGAMTQNKAFAKSLNEIKANLSVAFTPIIEAVMPLITRLTQGLATVTKYIASFVAAIFGKTYKQAVSSTKKLQAQANASKKSAASMSRDFDELHTVEKDTGDSADTSGGVNYDALDTSALDTGPMRKFQEILDKIKSTLSKLTPAFKDLYDKGIRPVVQWLGEKLKDALAFVGQQFEKVGDWLVEHKDSFSRLGESLGKLWEALEPIFNAAWETLKTAIGGFIDYILLCLGDLIDVLPDAIDFVTAFLNGDWEGMKEAGKNIVEGLWGGLEEKWESLKTWIGDLIGKWIDYVKALFGIHSPSTVFADIGKNLIEGLINGITGLWDKLKTKVTSLLDNLKTTVQTKFTETKDKVLSLIDSLKNGLKTKLENVWGSFKSFINKILGGVESMINRPVSALNRFIQRLNNLRINVPKALGGGTIGFNINPFDSVSIPRLARGGIVDKPTLSMIGEAGKEAVVPLENNTEWMEKLAAVLGNTIAAAIAPLLQSASAQQNGEGDGRMVLNLDGQTVATVLVQLFRKYPQELKMILEGI